MKIDLLIAVGDGRPGRAGPGPSDPPPPPFFLLSKTKAVYSRDKKKRSDSFSVHYSGPDFPFFFISSRFFISFFLILFEHGDQMDPPLTVQRSYCRHISAVEKSLRHKRKLSILFRCVLCSLIGHTTSKYFG